MVRNFFTSFISSNNKKESISLTITEYNNTCVVTSSREYNQVSKYLMKKLNKKFNQWSVESSLVFPKESLQQVKDVLDKLDLKPVNIKYRTGYYGELSIHDIDNSGCF